MEVEWQQKRVGRAGAHVGVGGYMDWHSYVHDSSIITFSRRRRIVTIALSSHQQEANDCEQV